MDTSVPVHQGLGLRLIPAEPSHAAALFAITPPDTFRYFLSWPAEWSLAAFAHWFDGFRAGPRTRVYVVHDAATDAVLGSTSFLDIDATNRGVEVGATWYAPAVRGTRVNPACKLLMLGHVFDALARRVETTGAAPPAPGPISADGPDNDRHPGREQDTGEVEGGRHASEWTGATFSPRACRSWPGRR